ncbi:MAG: extracellular solute-binding protein [Oscillospiraceae bacterium]|nr:extracellular solute-binding protein [Oscillospiraceae bacterium]
MKKKFTFVLAMVMLATALLTACGGETEKPADNKDDNRVVIYSGAEEYRNEYFLKRLQEQFPDYDITIEYMPTGNLAAKLAAEGTDTDMDIFYDLDFSYAGLVEQYLADVSQYDQSIYVDDCKVENAHYLAATRNGGAIIVNPDVLAEKGIAEPTCYKDLLKPEYKNLISMPSPKSSGTGYMFVKSLVNAWGEEEAFAYFGALAENVLQFTESGSGPVNALVQGEVAVGLGMTAQAVTAINDGANLKILFFEEGSPYSLYGYAIPAGKETRQAVVDVFNFFHDTLVAEDKALYYPEQVFVGQENNIENYPTDIPYADMSNNTTAEKSRLLELWEY